MDFRSRMFQSSTVRVIWTVSSHWEKEWQWWRWQLLVTEYLLWATHLTWEIFIFTNSVGSVLLLPLHFSENGNWGCGKLCNLPRIIDWHVGFNSSSVWFQSWSSLPSCWAATAHSQKFKYVVGMDFAETWTESREEGTIKLADRRVWPGKGGCCDQIIWSWFEWNGRYWVIGSCREGEELVKWLQGVIETVWKIDVIRDGECCFNSSVCCSVTYVDLKELASLSTAIIFFNILLISWFYKTHWNLDLIAFFSS